MTPNPDAKATVELNGRTRVPPATLPLVAAVVLNWNLPAETGQCLRHLLASAYPKLQVVVVDNGSSDNSARIIAAEFPSVDLISLPDNRGYAGGNNVGITRALEGGADFVVLVN